MLVLSHDRAAKSDALALSARKSWLGLRFRYCDSDNKRFSRLARDTLVDPLFRPFPHLEAERDVVIDGHVWIQRIVLKDHRDVTLAR